MKDKLSERCKKIKLVLTDVDGVLTDGGMYYTADGDVMKKFHTRDGMGATLLWKNSISTIVVTKEKTKMVKAWVDGMKIHKLYDGVNDKKSILDKICRIHRVTPAEVAYIGDDINDVGLLKKVGLAGAPNDCVGEVREICHYVCQAKGGEGAFREFANLILRGKNLI